MWRHVVSVRQVLRESDPAQPKLAVGLHRCGGGPRGKHLWLGPGTYLTASNDQ